MNTNSDEHKINVTILYVIYEQLTSCIVFSRMESGAQDKMVVDQRDDSRLECVKGMHETIAFYCSSAGGL